MPSRRDADPAPVVDGMRAEDLDEVARIAADAGEHAWTRSALEAELAREVARCRVAREREGGPALAYALWWDVAGELSLLTIGTAPAARRRGLARALVERMLAEGRASGATECFLEVRPSNVAARTLYEHTGFERFDVRPRYYADGEDAWILRVAL